MTIVPPKGLILVTGANGYIASAVIRGFLDRGYCVRGTVRSLRTHQWMLSHFGHNFSLVEVADLSASGAFDEAVRGVDGIAHLAADVAFGLDTAIIYQAINSTRNLLETASREPRVKRVVITSSQATCLVQSMERPSIHIQHTRHSLPEETPKSVGYEVSHERIKHIYATARVETERMAWRWVADNKPGFILNTVIPNFNIDTLILPQQLYGEFQAPILPYASTSGAPSETGFAFQPWQGAEATTLLHLAALTVEEVRDDRNMMSAHISTGKMAPLSPEGRNLRTLYSMPPAYDMSADRGGIESGQSGETYN